MRFAYADPPYLGMGKRYTEHPESYSADDPEWHQELIDSLDEFDGWALSTSSSALPTILRMCPEDVRVMAWVKPFAAFKRNVNPSYAWEPVIVRGGRTRTADQGYMRDWLAESITLKKGLVGAKPERFCFFIFDVLNAQPGDSLTDLFPGTGIVSEAWDKYMGSYPQWASHINRLSSNWEIGKLAAAPGVQTPPKG